MPEFHQLPKHSFTAVYAIEATAHAPSPQGVYEQIYRVLKPCGTFGVFEWVMIDNYNEKDPTHRAIRLSIEGGDGMANMVPRKHAVEAITTLERDEDLAAHAERIALGLPAIGRIPKHWEFVGFVRCVETDQAREDGYWVVRNRDSENSGDALNSCRYPFVCHSSSHGPCMTTVRE